MLNNEMVRCFEVFVRKQQCDENFASWGKDWQVRS